jgi:maltose O-acetyltransferase
MIEDIFIGLKDRLLQLLARNLPGATTIRVFLHRLRGVKIGNNAWIGYDTILETSKPYLIEIGNDVIINERVMIIAHFYETKGVIIEDSAFVGPGSIIMPSVRVGKGSVIAAGSVVSRSVPPATFVQGNPAKPIAKCMIPLRSGTSLNEFYKGIVPIVKK